MSFFARPIFALWPAAFLLCADVRGVVILIAIDTGGVTGLLRRTGGKVLPLRFSRGASRSHQASTAASACWAALPVLLSFP